MRMLVSALLTANSLFLQIPAAPISNQTRQFLVYTFPNKVVKAEFLEIPYKL
jgi:hypothetical protein